MRQYRQGDILLEPCQLPDGVEEVECGKVTLAVGEATGHRHQLTEAILLRKGTELYAKLAGPDTLTHEEHAPIQIPAGTYHVIRQMEYTPRALRQIND